MSLVSYFFKLSMVLRNVHTVLTEDYQVSAVCPCESVSQDLFFQLPYWVSYVAFAVATVLLGGLLGLFLVIHTSYNSALVSALMWFVCPKVCCIDCVYPPRREDSEPLRR